MWTAFALAAGFELGGPLARGMAMAWLITAFCRSGAPLATSTCSLAPFSEPISTRFASNSQACRYEKLSHRTRSDEIDPRLRGEAPHISKPHWQHETRTPNSQVSYVAQARHPPKAKPAASSDSAADTPHSAKSALHEQPSNTSLPPKFGPIFRV